MGFTLGNQLTVTSALRGPTPLSFYSYPGLQFWFDASVVESLWQDQAKTTAVAATLDPVGAWRSRVNSKFVYQTDSGKKPIYETGVVNSKPGIKFDNTDDLLKIDDEPSFTNQAKFTLMAVVKGGNVVARTIFDATLNKFGISVSSNIPRGYLAADKYATFSDASAADAQVLILVYDGTQALNQNRIKLYRNGVLQTLTFTGTIPTTITSAAGFTIGGK